MTWYCNPFQENRYCNVFIISNPANVLVHQNEKTVISLEVKSTCHYHWIAARRHVWPWNLGSRGVDGGGVFTSWVFTGWLQNKRYSVLQQAHSHHGNRYCQEQHTTYFFQQTAIMTVCTGDPTGQEEFQIKHRHLWQMLQNSKLLSALLLL